MPKFLSVVWNWFRSRGTFFFLNLLIVTALSWLVVPFFDHVSSNAWIFGRYSPAYFAYLIALTVPVVLLACLVVLGSEQFNRNLLLVVLALFVIGETFARLRSAGTAYRHNDIYRFPRPYVEFAGEPNGRAIVNNYSQMGASKEDAALVLNELGFRGPLPSKDKGDEFRIIMLGGSTVFNGVPLSNSIAGQLEQLLHRDGYGNARVYNWGVVSFVSGQQLSLLVHTVSDYNPDLVIVYSGGNDVNQPYNYDPRPGYPLNWLLYEAGLRRIQNGDSTGELLGSLLVKSRLVTLLFHQSLATQMAGLGSLRKAVGYRSQAWEQEVSSTYLSNTSKMCAVAEGFHFKLAVFLQPMAFFKYPLVGKERSLLGGEEFQRYVRDTYQRIRRGIEELNLDYERDRGCYFFDNSDIFSNYDVEVFWDFIHVDNAGNEFVARQIYSQLKRAGFLDQLADSP